MAETFDVTVASREFKAGYDAAMTERRELLAQKYALECQNELLRLALDKAHEELSGRNLRTFSTASLSVRDDGAVLFNVQDAAGANVATLVHDPAPAHA